MKEYRYTLAGDEIEIFVYEQSDDLQSVFDLVSRESVVGFDTESSGLEVYSDGWFTRLAQFGNHCESHVLRYDVHRTAIISLFRQANSLAVHNGDHDLHVLAKAYGIPLEESCPKVIDTLTISRIFDPYGNTQPKGDGKIVPSHALKSRIRSLVDGQADLDKELDQRFRDLKLRKNDTKKGPANAYAEIPIDDDVYARYAGLDPVLAVRLLAELTPLGTRRLWELVEYERRISYVLASMVHRGVKVDQPYATQQALDLRAHAVQQRQAAFNMGWPVEGIARKADKETLDEWLDSHDIRSPRTDKGGLSFNKEALAQVLEGTSVAPVYDLFRESMENDKFSRDYLDKFAASSRLHPVFDGMGAQTGRMSVSNPPLQQLPRTGDVRGCLVADEGRTLVSADLAQVEFCVGAGLSGDTNMARIIREGGDIHDILAGRLFGEAFTPEHRNLAKRSGFGRLYGAGKFTVARQCGVDELLAEKTLKGFDEMFPRIKRYGYELKDEVENGSTKTVTTPFGRNVAADPTRPWSFINFMVQSTARDVFCLGVLRMVDAGLLPYMWLFVHDEAILNVPVDEAEDVRYAMTKLMSDDFMGVPIRAEGEIKGKRWTK